MDKFSAALQFLTPDEFPHALRFVDLMELVGNMHAREADEWRRRIEAWCLFRLWGVPVWKRWPVSAALLEEPDLFSV
jgi:hypothetical protein